jgi:hypothetical protein
MQRAPELKPRIELTPIQSVEGVEIARCFDWHGPQVTCFPGFTFSAGVAKFRYGALEGIATCVQPDAAAPAITTTPRLTHGERLAISDAPEAFKRAVVRCP